MSLLDDFSHEEVDEAERYMPSTLVTERNRTKMLQALTTTQKSRRSIMHLSAQYNLFLNSSFTSSLIITIN
jgi:hypothetical protein